MDHPDTKYKSPSGHKMRPPPSPEKRSASMHGYERPKDNRSRSEKPTKCIVVIPCSEPSESSTVVPKKDCSAERISDIREKFTSPSRERSTSESKKRIEEKQAKAQEARERYLEEKMVRSKEIAKKVDEIKAKQEEQQMQKSVELNTKLQKAGELRNQELTKIKRRAHDEDSKVSEILFINKLEAQNKRLDILSKEKDSESRLQELHEERQRKQDEKVAKEAAVEDRRKALEAEHQQRLIKITEKRKLKDHALRLQMQEKEKGRLEHAELKERNRQQKLSAVSAAQQATVDELQKKIFQKQEASQKRYLENMDQKRQKAIESSIRRCTESPHNDDVPRSALYETQKMCSLCKILIGSEVYLYSHLRGKKHQDAIREQHQGQTLSSEELEYNLNYIVDAPAGLKANDFNPELASLNRERLKSITKRCKRLKQRIVTKSSAFETDWKLRQPFRNVTSQNKSKTSKLVKELNSLNSDTRVTGPWSSNQLHSLERAVSGLQRIVTLSEAEQLVFCSLDGLSLLTNLLNRIIATNKDKPAPFTDKTFVHICTLLGDACSKSRESSRLVFFSNIVSLLLDCLAHRLTLLVSTFSSMNCNFGNRKFDPLAGALGKLLASIIDTVCKGSEDVHNIEHQQRMQDVVSYTISIGIVDKLSLCIVNAQGPVDGEPELARFLHDSLSFLTTLTKLISTSRSQDSLFNKPEEDTTQLIITMWMTQICGVVPLVYGMLLHSGVFSTHNCQSPSPTQSPKHTLDVAEVCLNLLNHVALVDIQMLQAILGSEGLSLQLRHISSYLLWYCSHWNDTRSLLHEVVLLLGYFTVLNADNQSVVQSGQKPTILQKLCMMPFEYFNDPQLKAVLFPTLICCCYNNPDNKRTLEEEMSPLMLISFIESTMLDLQLKAITKQKAAITTSVHEEKWSLAVRFPKNQWTRAKLFLGNPAAE